MGYLESISLKDYISDMTYIFNGLKLLAGVIAVWVGYKAIKWAYRPPRSQYATQLKKGLLKLGISLNVLRGTFGAPPFLDKEKHCLGHFFVSVDNPDCITPSFPIILEIWEPSDRWVFEYNTEVLKILDYSKFRDHPLTPGYKRFEVRIMGHGTEIGAICLNYASVGPDKDDRLVYRLSCVGENLIEGEIDVPSIGIYSLK